MLQLMIFPITSLARCLHHRIDNIATEIHEEKLHKMKTIILFLSPWAILVSFYLIGYIYKYKKLTAIRLFLFLMTSCLYGQSVNSWIMASAISSIISWSYRAKKTWDTPCNAISNSVRFSPSSTVVNKTK